MKTITIFLIIIITSFLYAFAQDNPNSNDTNIELHNALGGYLYFNYNNHISNFTKLSETIPNCCPLFKSASGTGISFGLFYERPFNEKISGMLRIGYSSLGGEFKVPEKTYVSVQGIGVDGTFEHRLSVIISTVGIEPLIKYNIGALSINAGLNAGFMLTKTFEQKEQITEPVGQATFLDEFGNDTGEYIRNDTSGTIPNASAFQLSLLGGLSYELPLNKKSTLFFVPELFYSYGLTPLASGKTWSINTLRAGISLKYNLPVPCPTDMERDDKGNCVWTPCPPCMVRDKSGICKFIECPPGQILNEDCQCVSPEVIPFLSALIESVLLRGDGQPSGSDTIHVNEFEYKFMQPFLNYIFFDEGKSTIPGRYIMLDPTNFETVIYNENKSVNPEDPLQLYYDVLNIVGKRMSENPKTKITLVAYNIGGSEKDNPNIPKARLREVFDYLFNVWKVPLVRIRREVKNLSENLYNASNPETQARLRRVEIIPDADCSEILEPIFVGDTSQSVYPANIKFKIYATAASEFAHWKFRIMQYGDNLLDTSGVGKPPDEIYWKLNPRQTPLISNLPVIDYRLEVYDRNGQQFKTNMDKPIILDWLTINNKKERTSVDTIFANYTLFPFGYYTSLLNKYLNSIGIDKINSKAYIITNKNYIGEEWNDSHGQYTEAVKQFLLEKKQLETDNIKILSNTKSYKQSVFPEEDYYKSSIMINVQTRILR